MHPAIALAVLSLVPSFLGLLRPVLAAESVAREPAAREPAAREPQEATEEWVPYPYASGCYGGELCGGNGGGAVVRLAPRPVVAVRFYAHDEVGEARRGRLRVRIDHHLLARALDISRHGAVMELDGVGLSGRDLHIETLGAEEVVVEDLEVRYAPPLLPEPVGADEGAGSTAAPP